MTNILFVDESGSPPARGHFNNRYFVLGGLVIPSQRWHDLSHAFSVLKQDYNINGEVKWRYFSPSNNQSSNALRHLPRQDRDAFRNKFFDLITGTPEAYAIGVIADCRKIYDLHADYNRDEIYHHAYRTMVSFFNQSLYVNGTPNAHGIVICDHRSPREDKVLQNLHYDEIIGRSSWMPSIQINDQPWCGLMEGLLFSPSHHSVGIQCADCLAGAIYQKIAYENSYFYNKIKGLLWVPGMMVQNPEPFIELEGMYVERR